MCLSIAIKAEIDTLLCAHLRLWEVIKGCLNALLVCLLRVLSLSLTRLLSSYLDFWVEEGEDLDRRLIARNDRGAQSSELRAEVAA